MYAPARRAKRLRADRAVQAIGTTSEYCESVSYAIRSLVSYKNFRDKKKGKEKITILAIK